MSAAPVRERIAVAADELFVADGVRATSVERIAARAGCSRMTVYRHFPGGKADIIREVVLRQVLGESDAFELLWTPDRSLEDRLSDTFVWAVETMRSNPLLVRMLESEPESVVLALTLRGETIMRNVTDVVGVRLRDAGLDDAAANMLAELLCRLVVSITLQPYGHLRLGSRAELDGFAQDWVVPWARLAQGAASGGATLMSRASRR